MRGPGWKTEVWMLGDEGWGVGGGGLGVGRWKVKRWEVERISFIKQNK